MEHLSLYQADKDSDTTLIKSGCTSVCPVRRLVVLMNLRFLYLFNSEIKTLVIDKVQ